MPVLGQVRQTATHHLHGHQQQVLRPGHRRGHRPQRDHHGNGVLHDAAGTYVIEPLGEYVLNQSLKRSLAAREC